MAVTTTLDTLHQRVLQEINQFRGHSAILTTTGAGSTTSLVVGSLAYSSASAYNYDGVNVYCPTVTSAPKTSRVTRGGFTGSSGTFVMAPAYGSSPGNAASVYLSAGFDITAVDEAINDVIRTLYLPRFLPLSLVTDGDMETTGTSNWTTLGGGSAVTKTTTSAQLLLGKQGLDVTCTASGEGVRTASIAVSKFETLTLSVPVKISDNTKSCQVILYNADTSTAVQTATITGSDWEEVRFAINPNTENVQVRIQSNTTGTFHIYVGWVGLTSNERRLYSLPSSVVDANDVLGFYTLPLYYGTQDNFTIVVFSENFVPIEYGMQIQDYAGVKGDRVEISAATRFPVFVQFRAPDTVLSQNTGDTGTTIIPVEIIVEGALARLYAKLAALTLDRIKRSDYQQQMAMHSASYDHLKDTLNLSRPNALTTPSRRVLVP